MKNLLHVSAITVVMIGCSSAIAASQNNNSQQKIDTITSMYANHKDSGQVINASTLGLDLVYLYGGLDLKDSIMRYQDRRRSITDDGSFSVMDCVETYPSIYAEELRDDINNMTLRKASILNSGRVRADIKAYTVSGENPNYKHDFELMCNSNQCLVTDVYTNGKSLQELLEESCYQ